MNNQQVETPGEKTMRRWYEGRLAARMVQIGQMALDREILRRGARKMQDGVLGEETNASYGTEGEPMDISIGDKPVYNNYHQSSKTPSPLLSTLIGASLALGGVGTGAYMMQPTQETEPVRMTPAFW